MVSKSKFQIHSEQTRLKLEDKFLLVKPRSNGPATNEIPPIIDANLWSH